MAEKVKPAMLVIGLLVLIVVFVFAVKGGTFSVTGNSECPPTAINDDNGNALHTYQDFRDTTGNQDITDQQFRDAGVMVIDGQLMQTGQCPEPLVTP